jgi:hypothetical protein|nr:MAG TPA: hypothetical protein [Bacteriophage sp.]
MTREEKYKRLDKKRPLKCGSHRESILRRENYQRKVRSLIKEIPYEKFDELLREFERCSRLGKDATSNIEIQVIVGNYNEDHYVLVKEYSYELFKEVVGSDPHNLAGFYLPDFLYMREEFESILYKVSDLKNMGIDLWDEYIREEKNEEYLNFKKEYNVYWECSKFEKYMEKTSLEVTGLSIEDVLCDFTQRRVILEMKDNK